MIIARQIGVEALRGFFEQGLLAFQRAKLVQMRKAGIAVRDVARWLASLSIQTRPKGYQRRVDKKGRKLGPLIQKITSKVKLTRADVWAKIGPTRLAFYGRFLETGISKSVTRKTKSGRSEPYQMRIKALHYLNIAAQRTEGRVIELVGDSYDVFTGGDRPLTGRAAYWSGVRAERSAAIAQAYRSASMLQAA